MRLTFSGAPEIAAPAATVWKKLLDPDFVGAAAPGVESITATDPTHFNVVVALGVGALKLRFTLAVELHDLVEPVSARMRARGKAPGSNVDTQTAFTLEPMDPGHTRLRWQADTDVSGTIASVGARLLEGTARRLTEEFWTTFAARISADEARG